MFVTIITDCQDENTRGRQLTRANALFGAPANLVGISTDVEASGNLVDVLDASDGMPGVVLVNIAPRDRAAKKWGNGTPFGCFWYGSILVVSTIDGFTLSFAKKLDIIKELHIFNIPAVTQAFSDELILYAGQREYVLNTQFRSFEFAPRVAKWLLSKKNVLSDPYSLENIPDMGRKIWWVDSFGEASYGGNCKTTISPEEVDFKAGKAVTLEKIGKIICYDRLKDVPDGEAGLVIGSSGLLGERFLEIVVQGGNAAEKFGLKSGDAI